MTPAESEAGEHTEPERYAQLLAHRASVQARVGELEAALVVLDSKTAIYESALRTKGLL